MQSVSFITDDEKRVAAGYGPAPVSPEVTAPRLRPFQVEGQKYSPDQPRVPAGNSDGGQWTDGGGGGVDRFSGGDGNDRLAPPASGRSGYPINVLDEDQLGGHTFERHVNKPEEYLKARVLESRKSVRLLGLELGTGEKRAGSFTSLEAANKLVNSVMSEPENQAKLKAFAERKFPFYLPVLYLFSSKDFGAPTGYEAFAPNDRSQPVIRATRSVKIEIRRTDGDVRGYYVNSAYPINEDE